MIERMTALFGWALMALMLAGCGSTPPSPAVPAGFDLSGKWALIPERSDVPPTLLQLRARGGMLHLVAQDFPVIAGRRLEIQQDRDSMGLSVDDSAWRDVSWGARKRGLWEVQAGWLNDQLVILSKAEDADARESFQLSSDGRELTVIVAIRSGGEQLSVTRTFSRL